MNSFYEHHRDNIHWHYRCFDRILLNGLIQPFQQPERVVGFFNTYCQLYPVTRYTLRDIADQFQRWVTAATGTMSEPGQQHGPVVTLGGVGVGVALSACAELCRRFGAR